MSKPKTPAAKSKVPSKKAVPSIARRDATGHLAPQYKRGLLEGSGARQDEGGAVAAFIVKPRTAEELGEELGEAFVQSATSGEEAGSERRDRLIPEEDGGPFVPSKAEKEFAGGTDASNFEGATREPLPKTSKADP
jgi:hypothetical protein